MYTLTRSCALLLGALAMPAVHADALDEHQGNWLGAFSVPNGPTIKIGASLFARADGTPWASVAVPDQHAYDIPVKAIRRNGATLTLDIPGATIKLKWDQDHFSGQFQETGGAPFALQLQRVDQLPIKLRPQTPQAPFPYKDETLAIPGADGVVLGATLSLPNGIKHPPLVVLVHGSGPANRDESGAGHQPFAVLADYLARQGIAVLRYDKRGIGRSSGDYEQHTAVQLSADLHAVLKHLRAGRQFSRIGVLGHSEGPGLAAAVAARDPQALDFLVSLGGVGLNGLDMMLLQDQATAISNGASQAQSATIVAYARRYYQVIIDQAEVAPRLAALAALDGQRASAEKAMAHGFQMDQGSLSAQWADKPFLRAQLMSDTPRDWRAVRCPVLALNGSIDRQVPLASLDGIGAALKAGGNTRVDMEVMPSLNHMFQSAKTGNEDEYDKIEETIAPLALQRITAFVASLH